MMYYGREMGTMHPTGCEVMTWDEAEEMEALNRDNGYGFSVIDELDMIIDHMRSELFIKKGDDTARNGKREQEMIEWRLEDANFHTLCKYLHEKRYDEARDYVIAEDEE